MPRLRRAPVAALLALALVVAFAPAPKASAQDRDCPDFVWQEDAQAYFEAGGGSPDYNFNNLDADHDGIACEDLPSRGQTPTPLPTDAPTAQPTDVPTEVATDVPTIAPTSLATEAPTATPTDVPTEPPTPEPTGSTRPTSPPIEPTPDVPPGDDGNGEAPTPVPNNDAGVSDGGSGEGVSSEPMAETDDGNVGEEPTPEAPAYVSLVFPTATPDPEPIPVDADEATVVEVVDGDTLKVALRGGRRTETVRLIGVDTPETRDPNNPVECYGAEATIYSRTLFPEGGTVWLERDVSERDRYGRLLRYVWTEAERAGDGYLANERLVRDGYAVLSTFPPDVGYVDRFRLAEAAARDEEAGLWRACGGADTPAEPTSAPESAPAADDPTPLPLTASEPTLEPAGGAYELAEEPPTEAPSGGGGCDPSYPDVCIPPPPPDLDCGQLPYRDIRVIGSDPHRLDREPDGIGCES